MQSKELMVKKAYHIVKQRVFQEAEMSFSLPTAARFPLVVF